MVFFHAVKDIQRQLFQALVMLFIPLVPLGNIPGGYQDILGKVMGKADQPFFLAVLRHDTVAQVYPGNP